MSTAPDATARGRPSRSTSTSRSASRCARTATSWSTRARRRADRGLGWRRSSTRCWPSSTSARTRSTRRSGPAGRRSRRSTWAAGRRRCSRPADIAAARGARPVPLRAGRRRRGHDRGEPGPGRARRRGGARRRRRQPRLARRAVVRSGAPRAGWAGGIGRRTWRTRSPRRGRRASRPCRSTCCTTCPGSPRPRGRRRSTRRWRSSPTTCPRTRSPWTTRISRGSRARSGDHLPTRAGARRWRASAVEEQDDDRAAAQYGLAVDRLAAAGFRGYEISNWARPGHESRHNLAYWLRRPYEAVGPGAHAFDGSVRRWNAARLDGYLAALLPPDGAEPRLPPGGADPVDAEARPRRRRRSSRCAWTRGSPSTTPRRGRLAPHSRGRWTPACSSGSGDREPGSASRPAAGSSRTSCSAGSCSGGRQTALTLGTRVRRLISTR